MNYSAFEQAAAEANFGAKEVETQMEQLRAQMEQLKSKWDLLRTLSHQLNILRSDGTTATTAAETPREMTPGPVPLPPAEAVPAPAGHESDAEMARARAGWFVRRSEPGTNGAAADSNIRSRL